MTGKRITFLIRSSITLALKATSGIFVPDGASERIAVQSDSYHTYSVKDVAQSGEYYCYIECLIDDYVVRFFTKRAVPMYKEACFRQGR